MPYSIYLLTADNLTSGFLELTKLSQEIPKARLSNNMIRSKDSHPVKGRIGLLLRRQLASDDFVFLQLLGNKLTS